MNKTGALCGDEVGQIKLILRFSSMNSLKVSCLDTERKYMCQRLSTFFQIDFKVIRTMRSKNFSFSFVKNVSKFMILGRNIRKIRSFCKFYGVSLNIQRMKTEFEIAGVQEF